MGSRRNAVLFSAALLVSVVAATRPSLAQIQHDLDICTHPFTNEPDQVIRACSLFIQRKRTLDGKPLPIGALSADYELRAIAYDRKGNTAESLRDFDESIRMHPTSEAYNLRGNAYYKMGDKEAAILDYGRAIAANPRDGMAYVNRGNVYVANRDFDRALADYTEAGRVDPKYLQYREGGQRQKALDDQWQLYLKSIQEDFDYANWSGPPLDLYRDSANPERPTSGQRGAGDVIGSAEKRVALVIGNSAYAKVAELPNPVNDARAMSALFKAAGFEVVESWSDLNASDMRRVLRDFSVQARDADMAVVYFAGYGIEMNGTNYLIPVDAALERDIDVEDEAISLGRVSQLIEHAKRLRLIILDACRENPFASRMRWTLAHREVGRGLARVDDRDIPADTMVTFATKAGSTAADGSGPNSPYTSALLKHLTTPGLDVRLALGRVRDEVLSATGGRQEPFVYGSLGSGDRALAPRTNATLGAGTMVR
jgi:tetratricopeptide (TPR) repeat protein